MRNLPLNILFLAFLAGVLTVFGFAPFNFHVIPIITIAALCYLCERSVSSSHAAWVGLSFGLGMYAFGLYWMVGTLHGYGEMPLWLALISTAVLCLFMASFTGIAVWISHYLQALWLLPFLWGLGDWMRAWVSSGFPWLVMGYSQVPSSPLAGYLPVIGIYGVSILVIAVAVLLYKAVTCFSFKTNYWKATALAGLVLIVVGACLNQVAWTEPYGSPIKVALLQGNITQHEKWSVENSKRIVITYLDMIKSVDAQLIVLPETAFPIFLSQAMGKTREMLESLAHEKQADILVGMLDWSDTEAEYQKFNAVVNYGVSGLQVHHKTHLVPFGEYVPLKPLFGPVYERWFNMPHNDFNADKVKKVFQVQGLQAAISICYEDMFGEELAAIAGPANFIVSVSNGAWFGQAIALEQYMQFSQARALENRKMLIRSTNNGVTAMIDRWGRVVKRAEEDRQVALVSWIQPFFGHTFYNHYGNSIFWALECAALFIACLRAAFCNKKFT